MADDTDDTGELEEASEHLAAAVMDSLADKIEESNKSGESNKSKRSNRIRAFPWRSASIIGVLAALLGGLGTGLVTYFTTVKQMHDSAREARTEFYRTQKQALFTNLLSDSGDAYYPVADYAYQFATLDPNNYGDFVKMRDDVSSKVAKVRDDYFAIRILGGECVAAAKVVADAVAEQFGITDNLYRKWHSGDLSEDVRKASYVKNPPEQQATKKAEDDFSDIAHGDLDNT